MPTRRMQASGQSACGSAVAPSAAGRRGRRFGRRIAAETVRCVLQFGISLRAWPGAGSPEWEGTTPRARTTPDLLPPVAWARSGQDRSAISNITMVRMRAPFPPFRCLSVDAARSRFGARFREVSLRSVSWRRHWDQALDRASSANRGWGISGKSTRVCAHVIFREQRTVRVGLAPFWCCCELVRQ